MRQSGKLLINEAKRQNPGTTTRANPSLLPPTAPAAGRQHSEYCAMDPRGEYVQPRIEERAFMIAPAPRLRGRPASAVLTLRRSSTAAEGLASRAARSWSSTES
jgi:hypothetical protein